MFFNKRYLWQNLKKSRTILLFLLCIVPFINMWIIGTNLLSRNYIIDFKELSNISFGLSFILPIILAFLLFGFVFDRKWRLCS